MWEKSFEMRRFRVFPCPEEEAALDTSRAAGAARGMERRMEKKCANGGGWVIDAS